jgi:RNA polymerase sigma factor (sigma-70 family)|tara:strand:+ start:2065 stop:2865 length:801 start_codon:yes stop_codon:yes gene_type:complete
MIEYNKDMTRLYQKIDRTKQKELWERLQKGDVSARDEIIYSCLPLVVDIAKKFRINNKHIDLEDLVQEGNIALMAAVNNWDANRAAITTVATWYVRNSLIDMIHDAKYKIKNPLSMSRRAAEELSKINRCETNNLNEIAQHTNLGKKRIEKLLSVDVKHRRKLHRDDVMDDGLCAIKGQFPTALAVESQEEEDQRPCLADLIVLSDANLKGIEKEIFLRWSGLKGKKQGVKKIGEELNLTRKETMSHLSSAKRTLRKKAKEEFADA